MTTGAFASFLALVAFLSRDQHLILAALVVVTFIMADPKRVGSLVIRLWPLLLIILVSAATTVANGAYNFYAVKGVGYALKPVVYILFGYLVVQAGLTPRQIIGGVVAAATLLAAYYVAKYLLAGGASLGRYELRDAIGHGFAVWGIALAMLIISFRRDILQWNFQWRLVTIFLIGTAVWLSASRSYFIYTGIMLLPFLHIIRVRVLGASAIALAVALLLVTTPLISLFVSERYLEDLLLSNTDWLRELVPIEKFNDYDVTNGWRGYETFLAFDTVNRSGLVAQIMGTGLHSFALVSWDLPDIGVEVPVFHNGYSFAYMRAGAIGLVLLICQFWLFATDAVRMSSSTSATIRIFSYLLLGAVCCVVITTPTVAGLYNPDDTAVIICILIGSCYGVLLKQWRRHKEPGVMPIAATQTKIG